MEWKSLNSENQLDEIIKKSTIQPVLVFKHSTRCSISQMVLSRFERGSSDVVGNTEFYFLDLLSYKNISNLIAEKFEIKHESPQTLLISNGKCVKTLSHNAINFSEAVMV